MLLVLWYYKFAFIFIKVLVLTDLIKIRTLPMALSHRKGSDFDFLLLYYSFVFIILSN